MGNVPYSPQLIQHALSINFWKLQLKKQKGLPVSSRLLQRKRCQAQIPLQSFSNLSIQDIQNQIHHHQQQWNQKKKEAIQLGKAFLDEKAKGPSSHHPCESTTTYSQQRTNSTSLSTCQTHYPQSPLTWSHKCLWHTRLPRTSTTPYSTSKTPSPNAASKPTKKSTDKQNILCLCLSPW